MLACACTLVAEDVSADAAGRSVRSSSSDHRTWRSSRRLARSIPSAAAIVVVVVDVVEERHRHTHTGIRVAHTAINIDARGPRRGRRILDQRLRPVGAETGGALTLQDEDEGQAESQGQGAAATDGEAPAATRLRHDPGRTLTRRTCNPPLLPHTRLR